LLSYIECKYGNLFGQEFETTSRLFEKHPIDLAIGNFSVGMPFSKIFINKFYPLVSMGTEFYCRNKKHSQIYQTAKAGYYYNKYSTSAFFCEYENRVPVYIWFWTIC
jgi:hypothetical protein